MRLVFVFGFLVFSLSLFAQDFLLDNENMIFEFSTTKGKRMVIAQDTSGNYLVYRYGAKDKIEFEYPQQKENSWQKFKYSFYLRGGGPENEGLDLNYLYFQNGNFRYIVYDTYYSVEESMQCGIKVVNLTINKTTDISGDVSSQKGSLIDFRWDSKVEIGDELFD